MLNFFAGKLACAIPALIHLRAFGAALSTCLWAPDEKSPASDQIPVDLQVRAKSPGKSEALLPRANIRVDVKMVLIPVTVMDPLNRFVTGLEKDNFKIFENKIEQKIQQFSKEDDRSALDWFSTPAAAWDTK